MEFKDRLKALRQEKNISQQCLADSIFVSRSAVAKWENGLGIPNQSSYQALLNFFKITENELPLICEVEEVVITKNEKIHKLSRTITILCILLIILIVILVTAAFKSHRDKAFSYNWEKVDTLLDSIGEENNIYYSDGNIAQHGRMLNIFYSKDEEAEIYVRLTKIYRDNSDNYYQLRFEKHYYNMIDDKIVTVSYTCSFHYEDDLIYNLELARVGYFIGKEEVVDKLHQCNTYQITEKKINNGEFLSCTLEAIPTVGSFDSEFNLPGGDEKYIFDLMKFGFERVGEFFDAHSLAVPY